MSTIIHILLYTNTNIYSLRILMLCKYCLIMLQVGVLNKFKQNIHDKDSELNGDNSNSKKDREYSLL